MTDGSPEQDEDLRVLVMCTANICRSPMAWALLRKRRSELGVLVRAASAGFMFDDKPAQPKAIEVMEERGLDITGHQSKIVFPALLDVSHLVLTMSREHVRDATVMQPDAFKKIFTLKEFVRSARSVGQRRASVPFDEWLAEVGRYRTPGDYLRNDRSDDIADPMGGSTRAFRRCADEIETELEEFLKLI